MSPAKWRFSDRAKSSRELNTFAGSSRKDADQPNGPSSAACTGMGITERSRPLPCSKPWSLSCPVGSVGLSRLDQVLHAEFDYQAHQQGRMTLFVPTMQELIESFLKVKWTIISTLGSGS